MRKNITALNLSKVIKYMRRSSTIMSSWAEWFTGLCRFCPQVHLHDCKILKNCSFHKIVFCTISFDDSIILIAFSRVSFKYTTSFFVTVIVSVKIPKVVVATRRPTSGIIRWRSTFIRKELTVILRNKKLWCNCITKQLIKQDISFFFYLYNVFRKYLTKVAWTRSVNALKTSAVSSLEFHSKYCKSITFFKRYCLSVLSQRREEVLTSSHIRTQVNMGSMNIWTSFLFATSCRVF